MEWFIFVGMVLLVMATLAAIHQYYPGFIDRLPLICGVVYTAIFFPICVHLFSIHESLRVLRGSADTSFLESLPSLSGPASFLNIYVIPAVLLVSLSAFLLTLVYWRNKKSRWQFTRIVMATFFPSALVWGFITAFASNRSGLVGGSACTPHVASDYFWTIEIMYLVLLLVYIISMALIALYSYRYHFSHVQSDSAKANKAILVAIIVPWVVGLACFIIVQNLVPLSPCPGAPTVPSLTP